MMRNVIITLSLVTLIITWFSTQANLRGLNDRLKDDNQSRLLSLQSLTGFGGNPHYSYSLERCEGDCDDDNDCYGDLVCWQRSGGQFQAVPGCYGGQSDGSSTDYCVDPDDIYTPPSNPPATYVQPPPPTPPPYRPPNPPTLPPYRLPNPPPFALPHPPPVQSPVYTPHTPPTYNDPTVPTPAHSLGECQGDCDSDADCEAGLYCYQRDNFDPIPGCGGTDASRTDYCVKIPGYLPPQHPPVQPPVQYSHPTPTHHHPPHHPHNYPAPTYSLPPIPAPVYYPPPNLPPVYYPPPVPAPVYMPPPSPPPFVPPTPPPVPPPVYSPYYSIVNFRLKLYWQEGYYWQEEDFERKWCIECRNGYCNYGEKIFIQTCSLQSNSRLDFDVLGSGYFLIRLHGTNLCFERDFKDVFMMDCDPSNDRQNWFVNRGSLDGPRFEISPKTLSNHCMTQRHHPKSSEEIELEPCETVRRHSDTSYWQYY